jgi:large subunit ribosomal protein L30
MTKEKKIKITLIKSLIGRNKKQKSIISALGLKKINQSKIFIDSASVHGAIHKVDFMLKVEGV